MENIKNTFIHIGYPKAASTFLEKYYDLHPEINCQRIGIPTNGKDLVINNPDDKNISVLVNEKIADGIVFNDSGELWFKERFNPDSWNDISNTLEFNPLRVASDVHNAYPDVKILIILREQISWLISAYKYFLPRLPVGRRSFTDFCSTPRGIIFLRNAHYDLTVNAYNHVFGINSVKVLRFEELKKNPGSFTEKLCQFLEVQYLPSQKEEENKGSSMNVTLLRSKFGWLDQLPASCKKAGRDLINRMPQIRHQVLSDNERRLLSAQYMESNRKLKMLINK